MSLIYIESVQLRNACKILEQGSYIPRKHKTYGNCTVLQHHLVFIKLSTITLNLEDVFS